MKYYEKPLAQILEFHEDPVHTASGNIPVEGNSLVAAEIDTGKISYIEYKSLIKR